MADQDPQKQQLEQQLTRAWNARWSQDQVIWRIFGSFWPTNAILLAALFRSGNTTLPRPIGVVTCSAGICVAVVWFLIQRRAIGHINRIEETAMRLESDLLGENKSKYALSRWLNLEDAKKIGSGPSAEDVVKACIIVIGFAWLIGLLSFLVKIFCAR